MSTLPVVRTQCALVALRDPGGDGKAKTMPAVAASACVVYAIEGLEDVLKRLVGHTGALVFDNYFYCRFIIRQRNVYGLPLICKHFVQQ